jgi:hypothetical protein
MVIERNHHLCNRKDFPYFVHNFKVRYEARDELLIKNQYVQQFGRDDTKIQIVH